MAFTIPLKRKVDLREYLKVVSKELNFFKAENSHEHKLTNKEQLQAIDSIESIAEKVHSPLQQLEHTLHGWVSYIIMPIFVLANAGVLSLGNLESTSHITINIALALVLGNVIGITLLSALAIKLKLADLPKGVNFK